MGLAIYKYQLVQDFSNQRYGFQKQKYMLNTHRNYYQLPLNSIPAEKQKT